MKKYTVTCLLFGATDQSGPKSHTAVVASSTVEMAQLRGQVAAAKTEFKGTDAEFNSALMLQQVELEAYHVVCVIEGDHKNVMVA